MRWFQLDADTPTDPKILAILKTFGNAGFGALVRLWCFIAAHGKKPGWSLDSRGKPIDREILIEASGLSSTQFDELLRESTRNGLVRKISYVKRGVIVFPAMCRRADTYTKRSVRTKFEHSSNNVRHNNTKQDSTKYVKAGAPKSRAPSAKTRTKTTHAAAPTRAQLLKVVHQAIDQTPEADRSFANLKDLVKSECAKYGLSYDGPAVARAVEAATAVHK